jgi:hypothetical protein
VSIYDGFEGFRDPTENEALELLGSQPVIIDANVLLDIYSFEEPARNLALDVLEEIKARIWIPHQAIREFWRNRQSVIAVLPEPKNPLASVRQELFVILNGLRPDRERTKELVEIRENIDKQLADLATVIDGVRGAPLDVRRILADSSEDPILIRLESILDGRVGAPFDDPEEAKLVKEGLERFKDQIPPGYEDAERKKDQIPERGTGDFLLWEQTLRYVTGKAIGGFVLVTNDSKEDWRVVIKQPRKQALGIKPQLVQEAIARTGCRVVLLSQADFYRLMAKLRPVDDTASESLIEASARASETSDESTSEAKWSFEAYQRLVDQLQPSAPLQAKAVILAANNGGFVERAAIYESAGFSEEERSLKRFSVPANRIRLSLVEEGLLRDDAGAALEAIYEGPGKTIGYRVPQEFVALERLRCAPAGLTWLQAAAQVAQSDPEKYWTVSELVSAIADLGLRDLSNAKTPEATLGRDLLVRDKTHFESDGEGGYRIRRPATE